jgi:hypothetical protein
MVPAPRRQLAFPGNAARAPAGCEAGTGPLKSGTATKTAPDTAASPGRAGRSAGADVQAPEVFDGTAPGLLAGQAARVTITALRRAEDAPAAAAPAMAAAGPAQAGKAAKPTPQAEPAAAETGALHIGAVAAAIDRADARTPVMDPDAMAQSAPAAGTAAAPAASSPAAGGKSHGKLGIFSVEANARRAADPVTRAGASAALRKEASKGKLLWSVPAGLAASAASAANRDALLQKIKGLGSANACFVSR